MAWKVKLVNCNIQFFDKNIRQDEKAHILIREMKLIQQHPFLIEHTELFYPSEAPYDFSFWKSSLQNALETFQWDQDRLLVDNSAFVMNHMKKYLISERELIMLQIGASKTSYLHGEDICSEMVCILLLFLIL